MRQKIASISQMLRLPSICVLCQQYHRQQLAVCELCKASLKKIGPACYYCALPLPDEKFLVCGLCSKKQPVIDHTLTAYLYEDPLRALLHDFKYKEALYLRSFLVDLMLEALPEQALLQTECLVPVPSHPRRIRERGFNQAAELAKMLAKTLGLVCELNLCKKIIHTQPQASLNSKARRRNLRQAFQAKTKGYQHITLVDDLLTTGSTANELAKVLKQQGVSRVDLWCCARTP
ncbi:DNA utilization protein GntX [Legionella massiliensis]|uniref:DNA utilization protein GntX n=1 Tax=Legionella massiliensis TaxID=1034943 RepID=A0A078KZ30_9GAMM|nr:ComF family protein [Legionella massiliensis]CDZ76958.1 DNA utilization protein GntX [Legionella massiliensis]CEE12696.1 DNA utilization protein GntX [Legionella massiliensis]